MAAFFKKIMVAVLSVSALASCSKDNYSEEQPYGVYTFILSDGDGKSVLADGANGKHGHWETGDRLGTVVGSESPAYSNITPGSPSSFRIYRPGGLNVGDRVYAYYPYNPAAGNSHAIPLEIPALQQQNGDVFDFDAMPMVAEPYTVTAASNTSQTAVTGAIYLYNLASLAEFKIFSSNSKYRNEIIESVEFAANSPLAGNFSIDITAVSSSNLAFSGYNCTTVQTDVSDGAPVPASLESSAKVYMVVAPGTYNGAVKVTTDKAVYRFPLKSAQTFTRSVIRGLGVDLGTCTDRTSRSTAVPVTLNMSVDQILAASGISSPENGVKYEVLTMDNVITVETSGALDSGKYYSSGSSWRIYPIGFGNVKIKAAPGYELQSVTLIYTINSGTSGGNTVYPSFDAPASGVAAAVSGSGITYHVTGAAGHVRITNISVTYVQSSKAPSRVYLGCYEMPAVESIGCISGNENFSDDEGTGSWYAFDTPDADRKLVTHTYAYSGSLFRNYTTMVDRQKRCALWVAYPMHGVAYANLNIGRSGSFDEKKSYDPGIPASWQSSGSTSDYNSGNGYSRGHLCASEDRQTTYAGNCQTFYYTNQDPQWQNSFNSGVWSALENKVQAKAATLTARDTLYVVSGVLFEDGNSGDSNDGGTVARPSHFYKLVMLCGFNGGGMMTSAQGAAFIYTNEAHTKAKDSNVYDYSGYRTTINAIEERTGFNFFAAVPSALQEAAESSFSNIL